MRKSINNLDSNQALIKKVQITQLLCLEPRLKSYPLIVSINIMFWKYQWKSIANFESESRTILVQTKSLILKIQMTYGSYHWTVAYISSHSRNIFQCKNLIDPIRTHIQDQKGFLQIINFYFKLIWKLSQINYREISKLKQFKNFLKVDANPSITCSCHM